MNQLICGKCRRKSVIRPTDSRLLTVLRCFQTYQLYRRASSSNWQSKRLSITSVLGSNPRCSPNATFELAGRKRGAGGVRIRQQGHASRCRRRTRGETARKERRDRHFELATLPRTLRHDRTDRYLFRGQNRGKPRPIAPRFGGRAARCGPDAAVGRQQALWSRSPRSQSGTPGLVPT
jgi:hypothetical protein